MEHGYQKQLKKKVTPKSGEKLEKIRKKAPYLDNRALTGQMDNWII